jgi:hypothetical protein
VDPSSAAGDHGKPAPEPGPGIGIFVCYRRDDTAGFARALKTVLNQRYGKDRVFMDLDSIAPGQRWEDVVNAAVGSCQALLALIGPEWLTIKDDEGQARLWNPQDPVRLEIEAALRENLLLIPILLQGARVPVKEDLPDGLAALPATQALTITDDWDAGVSKLVEALDAVVQESPASRSGGNKGPSGAGNSADHGSAVETGADPDPGHAVEPRRSRPKPRTMVVAGAVALAVIGGAIAIASTRHGPTAAPAPPTVGATLDRSASEAAVHDYLWNVYNLLQQSEEQKTQIASAITHKDAATLALLKDRRQSFLNKVQTWEVPPEAKALNDSLVNAFRLAVTNVGYWIDYANDTGSRDVALAYQNGTVRPAKYAVDAAYDQLRTSVHEPPPYLQPDYLF